MMKRGLNNFRGVCSKQEIAGRLKIFVQARLEEPEIKLGALYRMVHRNYY